MIWNKIVLLVLVTLVGLVSPTMGLAADKPVVKIGVCAHNGAGVAHEQWDSTAQYLSATLKDISFQIIPYVLFAELEAAVAAGEIDFVLANPVSYLYLEEEFGVTRLASHTREVAGRLISRFGGVIIAHADRTDVRTLADIHGKSLGAVHELDFGGWWMALREFKAAGLDPRQVADKVLFFEKPELVIQAVRDGQVAMGTMRTGILEQMARAGSIELADFTIIEQVVDDFPLLHSTRLYPEWTFARSAVTSEDLSVRVLTALLGKAAYPVELADGRGGGWTVPLSYREVHALMRELNANPYSIHEHESFLERIYRQRLLILGLLVAGAACLAFAWYVKRANSRLRSFQGELESRVQMRTQDLEASEKRFRVLFEQAAVGVVQVEVESGLLVRANQRCAEMFGYSVAKLQQLTLADVVCLDELGEDERWMAQFMGGAIEEFSAETCCRHRDGSKIWVRLVMSPVSPNEQRSEHCIAVIVDISDQQRAESALRRMQFSVDQSRDEVYWVERDGGFVYVNQAACRALGYEESELLALSVFDIDTLFSQANWAKHWQMTKQRGSLVIETEHRRKDGNQYPVEIAIDFMEFEGVEYHSAFARDISERREKERAFRERGVFLDRIIDQNPYPIWISDNQGMLIRINDACCRMLGIQRSEVMGLYNVMEDNIVADQGRLPLVQSVYAQGKTVRFLLDYDSSLLQSTPLSQGRHLMLNVTAAPIRDEEGKVTNVIFMHEDITEQKQFEARLQSAHDRFQTLVDSLDGLVYAADMETHEILFINEYGRERLGEDLVGQICWQHLQGGQKGPCEFCTNDQLLDRDGLPTKGCVWEIYNTRLQRWYELRDRAIEWTDGHYVRMAIALDITARKEAEENKKELEMQLRQAQKIEAVGTLAGGIAHDFNNILTPIICYSEMLIESPNLAEPEKQDVAEILTSAIRAQKLVRQILTFSREREHESAPTDVGAVVHESLKLIRASIPANIDIVENFDPEPLLVLGDSTRLHQVVMNLCTNAYQSMLETGGLLKVSLGRAVLDSAATSQLGVGTYLELAVADTGRGMDALTRERIFEPYFTTKEQGTGLGLAVVHGIIQGMRGEIVVESCPGQGTCFHIYLPLIGQVKRKVEESVVDEAELRGTEHVLLVDDEEVVLTVEARMLSDFGYEVTTRTSSLEALELFRNKYSTFDLVITDQSMPNMTGERLAKEMMAIRPDIPIVMCTGFSSVIDEHKAAEIGIVAFLLKPVLKKELASTVRKVLSQPARTQT